MHRESGSALLLTLIVSLGLVALTGLSLQLSRNQSTLLRTQRDRLSVHQIAESAAALAVARIKEGGQLAPYSGTGGSAAWASFGDGELYFYSDYDAANRVTTVRAWGRIATVGNPSGSTEAPDSGSWDGTGYVLAGLEVSLSGGRYLPDAPMYFGNGGVERPMGGFEWSNDADPLDSTTWDTVTSSPSSQQSNWVPMVVSSLNHPVDYLTSGTAPEPASSPHPYNVWVSQTAIGQFNVDAWFANSAGTGDASANVVPQPNSTNFAYTDLHSAGHPYALTPAIPDVQSFSWQLWSDYNSDPQAYLLSSGAHSGTYGTIADPRVTFATGTLRVNSGQTFSGTGILVIRDTYDPNTDTDNAPSVSAALDVRGTFEWTGLVIIAGWRPSVTVRNGAQATIVGAFFGEDSVQSGGEVSLDSATIVLSISDDFRVLYSREVFQPGGLIHDFMPSVVKTVVGVREL
ncbi:MAG: hypothetical protein AB7O52_14830 [Planctomycetota bacterium]